MVKRTRVQEGVPNLQEDWDATPNDQKLKVWGSSWKPRIGQTQEQKAEQEGSTGV